MKEYRYEAYTRDGRSVKGTERAESRKDVELLLESRGLLARSISGNKRFHLIRKLVKPVSRTDFLVFVGELISLLESGMGIPESLAILSDDHSNPELATQLDNVLDLIKSGHSFSSSCEHYPEIFEPFFISTLKVVENSGDQILPLRSYYNHLERTMELRRKLSQALIYPAFLIVTFFIIIMLMFIFVVPNFTAMYDDLSTELPQLTMWLLLAIEHLPFISFIVLASLLMLMFGIRWLKTQPLGTVRLSQIKQKLPLAGGVYRMFTYWQFTQALASLLRGGSNLLYAVRTAKENNENKAFSRQLEKVIERISNGEPLSYALHMETDFPAKSIKMISVGEEGSNLQAMLDSMSNDYARQLDDRIKRITTLVEPVLMLLIGLVVGAVIIALYLPVFDMVNVIG